MPKRLFVHVPYLQLDAQLPYLCERRLSPELFFSAEALESLSTDRLAAQAAELEAAGLSCTIHAPFMDLNPGSLERMLREITQLRFDQVLDAAAFLNPEVMVFHPGFDRWRYGEASDQWLKGSVPIWERVLRRVEGMKTVIAVENIFEEEPSTLKALLEEIGHPQFRHCFDVGHWNLFKREGMERWFDALGDRIAEVHIHDNRGDRDDHAPPGEGAIDFELFFQLMERYAPEAAFTVEAHSRQSLERSLTALKGYLGR